MKDITGYLQTYYEVVTWIEYFIREKHPGVTDFYNKNGMRAKWELAKDITDKFERMHAGRVWGGDWIDAVDEFVKTEIDRLNPTYVENDIKVSIAGVTVTMNDIEYKFLSKVCLDFTGDYLGDVCEDRHNVTPMPFSELNRPEPDNVEFNVSCWGQEGYKPNSIADSDAQCLYGCYFSVLIFLDGCNTFFRTNHEDAK